MPLTHCKRSGADMEGGVHSAVAAQLVRGDFMPVETLWFIALIATTLGIFIFFLARMVVGYHATERAHTESSEVERVAGEYIKFDVALNSMSQGLVMFDAAERLLLWNQSYLDLSGLPAAFMTPERTLTELLSARRVIGTLSLDIEHYITDIRNTVARGEPKTIIFETPTGRCNKVITVPMPAGGWLATYEDVTEQVKVKRIVENRTMQLNAAIANMPQGLCMFDKDQRLIVCNKQYAKLYGLGPELSEPGTPLRAILKKWGSSVTAPEKLESYVNDRISKVKHREQYQLVNHLPDGRHIAVVHKPMPGGGWVSTHEDVTDARRREESFRLLFENSPMAMWVMDCRTLKFLAVNEAVVSRYGYSREEFMTMSVPDLRDPAEREAFAAYLRDMPESHTIEGRRGGKHRKSDGTVIDVEVHSRPFTYNGQPARISVIQDITRQKQAADELLRTKKFLDAVIEHVPIPIVVRDVAGLGEDTRNARFHLFNRAYEELTGDTRERLIGKTADELYSPDRAEMIVRSDNEAIRGGQVVEVGEHTITTARNETRLLTAKKTLVRDIDGQPQYLLSVLDDVTERRRTEQRIAYLAHNDSLTGLPNRATFVDYLDATLAKAKGSGESFTILCIDLDRFKEVNDIYGHLVGDDLLREAARRFHEVAGSQFVARVGGDEFTLIAIGGDQPHSAKALGERLLAAFEVAFEIDGQRLQLGLSIGSAVYPADGDNATALIANADAALFQAKAEARGTMRMFDARIGARLHERRELQFALQAAMSRNEFFLHYQPQVKLTDGEITGFEALVRWQSPARGQIAPGEFIPIAEETGLIVPLGDWILREACREAASWPRPLKIAVNISPIQFRTGDLVAKVHLILLETGLAPNRLELEITEGVLIDDFQRAVTILRQLKSLGVQIAMDDFGKGYSSLSYLHSFGFDKIKIDRSFIGDIESSHHSMAIVRAIIMLGHSLEVPVLAEGVETESQRMLLAQEGCDEVQGYLTGRPLLAQAYAGVVGWKPEATPDMATPRRA